MLRDDSEQLLAGVLGLVLEAFHCVRGLSILQLSAACRGGPTKQCTHVSAFSITCLAYRPSWMKISFSSATFSLVEAQCNSLPPSVLGSNATFCETHSDHPILSRTPTSYPTPPLSVSRWNLLPADGYILCLFILLFFLCNRM